MKSPTPEEIKALREEAKLTQARMAELIGVTDRAFRYYEAGQREMPYSAWQLLKIIVESRKPEHD